MKKLLGLLFGMIIVSGIVSADDLANVGLTYCSTSENTLQYQLDPGVETGICYLLSNGTKAPVTIKVSFIDGTFTNDQRQNKACLSDTDTQNFGQYVTQYDTLVTLKAGETLQKNAKMFYPIGMDGLYHGCVVYSIVEKTADTTNATSFSILMRRAKFIDVIVGDPQNAKEKGIVLEKFTAEEGKNLSHNANIRIYKDETDNTYIMQLKIKNISPVEQNITMTGIASNILTYKNTFIESRKILKGDTLLITKKFDTTPSYNLTLKLNISNTPFTFGNETPVIGTITTKTTLWIWNVVSYITLIGILLFMGIVFLLIKDLKKKKSVKNVSDRPTHQATKKHTKK